MMVYNLGRTMDPLRLEMGCGIGETFFLPQFKQIMVSRGYPFIF
jgi:hypothetical protein